ncbi:[protein-PII] uridylyltransferase [Syntrophobacter fumaroxidans]|uniref:Bifunctional uridylyltransferase/uridylyl-removing enzyme n=1 Tax=Syntrophobacter fumaroxidans (strain DSM 10017 / MPOB) TaxID=335543 RepID=A0LFS1_SYNFM|nr:[protein-PII] uridylyltransferase [Syntrophobacter fumaroxidans]ABK16273.1 UTP-GlnB uridylyltransferase, GlnD [Syntrophobacter fumaroxidans MPOB]
MHLRPQLSRKLKDLRETFQQMCREDVPGVLAARTYAHQFHESLRKAFPETVVPEDGWGLLAVGGFGRGELGFASDIDLLLLYRNRLVKSHEALFKELVYCLWDSGFEVGHATASLSSMKRMAQDDFTVLTNILEARLIAGDPKLFSEWRESFFNGFGRQSRKKFLQNLVGYREERQQQYGGSSYLQEPHVKEGVGAMRDVHILRWAGHVFLRDPSFAAMVRKELMTNQEKLWLEQAYDFLWRVRLQLHRLTGRRQDQLLFMEQEQIAERFGCMAGQQGSAVEVFMRLYYRHTSRIRRTASFFLERVGETQKSFPGLRPRRRILPGPFLLEGKHLNFMEPEWIKKDPRLLMRFFWQAALSDAHFHHQAGQIIRENLAVFTDEARRDPEVVKQFFDILLDSEHAFSVVNVMLETGFLEVFIPEFAAVRYRVQNDVYHLYTVDEHLLRTVWQMHQMERGDDEVAGELNPSDIFVHVKSRRVLYLAALVHDIGKGDGRNHAVRGGAMAGPIAERLGLDTHETGLLRFLVEHHLILAETALKRDLMDEKPIAQCAIQIKDRERLQMLYLLTIADSRATGPGAWSTWKASLVRELFVKVDRVLARGDLQGQDLEQRSGEVQENVLDLVSDPAERERVRHWLERVSYRYLLSQAPTAIVEHHRMERALGNKPLVLASSPAEGEMWQLTVVTADRPGLFALITGVLWARGLNILSADIFTWESGVALDVLIVERLPDPLHPRELWERVEADLGRALEHRGYLDELLSNKRKPSILQQKNLPRKDDIVLVDEEASDFYTIIEVYTWDRPGVLHCITDTLYHLDVSIQLAKISTPGAQVADVFYVTDLSGNKLMDYEMHEKIRVSLLDSLTRVG